MGRHYRRGKGKWTKEREEKPRNIMGQRTGSVSSTSSEPMAPLILYYLTSKNMLTAGTLSGATPSDDQHPSFTIDELHQMTAREMYMAPLSQTTLDLATDEQKVAYIAIAMKKVPLASMARALDIAEYKGEDLRKTQRPPICRSLRRSHDKEMDDNMDELSSLTGQQRALKVLKKHRVEDDTLRRALALLVRWSDVADTENDAVTCARLLMEIGEHTAIPRHLEKHEFLQKAMPPFVLLDSAVRAVTLTPYPHRATVERVNNMLSLIGRFQASSTYRQVALEGLEYLALAESHKKLFLYTRNLKPWAWRTDALQFQKISDIIVEHGNHAAAGQFCKIVKEPTVQASFLCQMMRMTAAPKVSGAKDIDENLPSQLALDLKHDTVKVYTPPAHPFAAVESYAKDAGMPLFRLGSVFASQYVESGKPVLKQLTQRLLASGYLSYFLPRDTIHVVNDDSSLAEAIEYFSTPPPWANGCDCVGLDMEVEPNTRKGQRNPCSLLQVATRDASFVIDLLTLGDKAAPLISVLFESSHWLKVGLGFKGDMRQLRSSYSSWGCFDVINRLLDINELYRQLHPSQSSIGDASLDKLCVYTYGRHLNKAQQCSNWALRPLSDAQLQYAALDSLCLVGMFDLMRQSLQEVSGGAVDVHHFVSNVQNE